ncbi:MAG: NYN domain-containing protein [Elusimicrobiota bacterium]|jgi:predicted RNA-binding protein with PIN domain|nr:NYN domain-containing protein [Elusimicrobiota bacterium]
MNYIIDGYNVINSSDLFSANSLEARRNNLIGFVNSKNICGNSKNFVSIVFDNKTNGIGFSGYDRSFVGSVEVLFSGGMMSADDIIVEIVDLAQNPYEITVVTNDKGIKRRIATSGAKTENVEKFLSRTNKDRNFKKDCIKKLNDDCLAIAEINEELKELWLKK